MRAAQQAGLPVVLIAPDASAPADFVVRCDNADAGRLVAWHLTDLGHRRIAFAGGPRNSIDTRERLRGLREALAERGLDRQPTDVWYGTYMPDSGTAYAQRVLGLRRRSRPSAVVLGNDAMAISFMREVLRSGLRVPEDVSVVGFDGTPDGAQFWPGLTTVLQPTQAMAANACRALFTAIDGRHDGRSVIDYGVELLVRESTAPL